MMNISNGDRQWGRYCTTGEKKRTQRQVGKKNATQLRGGQKSKGTGRLGAITVTKIGIL